MNTYYRPRVKDPLEGEGEEYFYVEWELDEMFSHEIHDAFDEDWDYEQYRTSIEGMDKFKRWVDEHWYMVEKPDDWRNP